MKKIWMGMICVLLSACSGGSGNTSMPDTSSTRTSANNSDAGIDEQKKKMASVGEGGSNYYVRLNTTADPKKEQHSLSFDTDNIRVITVKGITFDLARVGSQDWGIQFKGHYLDSNQTPKGVNEAMVYNGSPNVTVGVLSTKNLDDTGYQNYAFFNGKFTDVAQMPVMGSATYQVSTAFRENQDSSVRSSVYRGPFNINVDFGTKKLDGVIEREQKYGGNIVLKADIHGNRFQSASTEETQVKGGFFGDHAAEIGGIYHDTNTLGAFVGKKQ